MVSTNFKAIRHKETKEYAIILHGEIYWGIPQLFPNAVTKEAIEQNLTEDSIALFREDYELVPVKIVEQSNIILTT